VKNKVIHAFLNKISWAFIERFTILKITNIWNKNFHYDRLSVDFKNPTTA